MNHSPENASRLGRMGRAEFIAMIAMLMALNALAIDIMLPGLQQIGATLGVENENHRQYIVSAYLIGFGLAQLAYGPLADRFGRRIPLLAGLSIYIAAAIFCAFVPSFTALLVLRFVQGLGAASMRVVTVSIVRDIYGGRQMAEAMSLIMMVFMIVPVIAPGIGQTILLFADWHTIFVFMAVAGLGIGAWTYMRLPETLSPADIRPFTVKSIATGFKIVLTDRIALNYTLASTFIFGALFGFINSAQQIYTQVYDLGKLMPVAFGSVALFMSFSSFINARMVGRVGMRRLSHGALVAFLAINFVWLMIEMLGPRPMPFPLFICLFAISMFMFGWIGANFNSLAMEPLGHVAGTASSVLGFLSTVGGASIGALIGQAFDGTALPLIAGFFAVSLVGFVFVMIAEKGKLFQPHNQRH